MLFGVVTIQIPHFRERLNCFRKICMDVVSFASSEILRGKLIHFCILHAALWIKIPWPVQLALVHCPASLGRTVKTS